MNKKQKAEKILGDKAQLSAFAAVNGLAVDGARALLQRLLEKPESSPEFDKYNFDPERSDDFKAYRAGLNDGKKDGNEMGFGKGVAIGMMVGAAGASFAFSKHTK